MNPKVSIVLPCYKAERFIADMVGDVLRQTYTDWELIVVSNGEGQGPQLAVLDRIVAENKGGVKS